MEHYVDVERAFCVEQYFRCESIVTVQRLFRKKFKVTRLKPVPTRNTIMRWVNNFRETANATNKKRPGKKKLFVLRKPLSEFDQRCIPVLLALLAVMQLL